MWRGKSGTSTLLRAKGESDWGARGKGEGDTGGRTEEGRRDVVAQRMDFFSGLCWRKSNEDSKRDKENWALKRKAARRYQKRNEIDFSHFFDEVCVFPMCEELDPFRWLCVHNCLWPHQKQILQVMQRTTQKWVKEVSTPRLKCLNVSFFFFFYILKQPSCEPSLILCENVPSPFPAVGFSAL